MSELLQEMERLTADADLEAESRPSDELKLTQIGSRQDFDSGLWSLWTERGISIDLKRHSGGWIIHEIYEIHYARSRSGESAKRLWPQLSYSEMLRWAESHQLDQLKPRTLRELVRVIRESWDRDRP